MTPGGPAEWAIAPEEVEVIRAHLDRHFPGGAVRALSEPSDPGQLFQVVDREGSRFTLKIMREAIDALRPRPDVGATGPTAPGGAGRALDELLARQEITRRLRRAGRVVIRGVRGEDAVREERL